MKKRKKVERESRKRMDNENREKEWRKRIDKNNEDSEMEKEKREI